MNSSRPHDPRCPRERSRLRAPSRTRTRDGARNHGSLFILRLDLIFALKLSARVSHPPVPRSWTKHLPLKRSPTTGRARKVEWSLPVFRTRVPLSCKVDCETRPPGGRLFRVSNPAHHGQLRMRCHCPSPPHQSTAYNTTSTKIDYRNQQPSPRGTSSAA